MKKDGAGHIALPAAQHAKIQRLQKLHVAGQRVGWRGTFSVSGRLPAAADGETLHGTAAVLEQTDAQTGKQALIVWTA
jgi:hypothetical protein